MNMNISKHDDGEQSDDSVFRFRLITIHYCTNLWFYLY